MNSRLLFCWGSLAALVLTAGCAGGSSRQPAVTTTTLTPADSSGPAVARAGKPPAIIYVTDFYLPPGMIQSSSPTASHREGPLSRLRQDVQNLRGDDPAAKAKKIIATLGETITRDLNKAGYRAEYRPSASGLRQDFFPAHEALPKEGWLLGGWFEQVREGDRLKEATVGFGSGSGQVSIEVVVSDLAGNPRQPFLCIGSENAKQRMPGGLVTMNPYAMAAKFVLARGETERDVRAMGSAIAKCLVQFIQTGPGTKSAP